MNAIFGLGRYLFAIPIATFGIIHFVNLETWSTWAPGGKAGVILAGLSLLAAATSFFIKKYDKLAAVFLAFLLILFVALIHFPAYLNAADPIDKMNSLSSLLKDLIIAGAALLYARHVAFDRAVIG